jgi:hypothetical protein
MIPLLIAAATAAVLVGVVRNQGRRRSLDRATVDLTVDDEGVSRRMGDGRVETVRWTSLQEVEVLAVEGGAHDGPVLILTGLADEGCLAPAALAVERGLIERLHALPGFDGGALTRGLQAEPPTRTSCWTRY